jgi:surface carbohydrate biosynthesis protein
MRARSMSRWRIGRWEPGFTFDAGPWVHICVHNHAREYDAKVVLAVRLAEAGFNVTLSRTGYVRDIAGQLPRGLIIDVTVGTTRDDLFKTFRAQGHRIAAFDEEAVAYGDPEEYKTKRLSVRALQELDVFYAWGERHRELVNAVGPAANVAVTGHPRMDLLRPEFREIYREKVEGIREKYGRFILVGSHGGLMFDEKFIARELAKRKARDPEFNETSERFLRGYYRYHREHAKDLVAFSVELSKALSSHAIVLRPKPTEDVSRIASLIDKDSAGIEIVQEGLAAPWILGADALIHNNSAIAVEAYFAGVPAFSYGRRAHPAYDSVLPNLVSQKIDGVDDFLSKFGLSESSEEVDRKLEQVAFYVGNVSGRTSVDAIVDRIKLALPNGEGADWRTDYLVQPKGGRRETLLRFAAVRKVRSFFGQAWTRRLHRSDSITVESARRIRDAAVVLGKDGVVISEIGNEFLCFTHSGG